MMWFTLSSSKTYSPGPARLAPGVRAAAAWLAMCPPSFCGMLVEPGGRRQRGFLTLFLHLLAMVGGHKNRTNSGGITNAIAVDRARPRARPARRHCGARRLFHARQRSA